MRACDKRAAEGGQRQRPVGEPEGNRTRMPGPDRRAHGDGPEVAEVVGRRARVPGEPPHAVRGPRAHMRVTEDGGSGARRFPLRRRQQVIVLA